MIKRYKDIIDPSIIREIIFHAIKIISISILK